MIAQFNHGKIIFYIWTTVSALRSTFCDRVNLIRLY